jgi:catechol-2,3-dioxygenase
MKKAIILLILIQFQMLLSDKKRKISLSFNHMALSVKDVNVSAEFYTNVLNFGNTLPPEAENVKWISLGDGKELHLLSIFKDDMDK